MNLVEKKKDFAGHRYISVLGSKDIKTMKSRLFKDMIKIGKNYL